MATDDVRNKIEENAQAPRSIETDGLRIQEHSLQDMIAADKHVRRLDNAASGTLPIRVGRFSSGGPAH